MNKNELIEFLQRQVDFLQGKFDEALASVNSLTLSNEKLQATNEKLVATVEELRTQIASLEDVIKGKGEELSKEKVARQAMRCLQEAPSERQSKPEPSASGDSFEKKPEKKRTNNGAKRKTHPECEIETVVVEPDSPDFRPEVATFIGECDVVRYVMVPMRFRKIYKVLGKAITEDDYICGDETYHKVRLQVATPSGRKIKKGYIWVFAGMTTGLVYFFYDDGSRSAEVFEQHIKGFNGAFQCDYYSGYRNIGIGEMSGIRRLPCLQHFKRKFLDIKDNPQGLEIAKLFGLLYHFEHKHRIGKDGWTAEDHLKWRQRYSRIMLEKIHMRLMAVKDRVGVPPDDPLLAATEHALKQWHEIPRIFESPTYRLDNNEVERINRYISLTRRRLTIGSHRSRSSRPVPLAGNHLQPVRSQCLRLLLRHHRPLRRMASEYSA